MEAPIASAVMLPEPEAEEQELDTAQDAESPQGGQKRRQSLVSELERKRARLDSADQTSSRNSGETSSAAVPRRREGERVRRLFGAVLGALSQNPATPAQKKRTDIEKRQKARRELQEQESDQRKAERIAQRTAQRRREQERFEKESLRTRHANLRFMAHFLQTEAEPRLYYKPWKTTADEEDRIDDQIADVEDLIRRELDEHGMKEDADADGERERHFSRSADAERDAGAHVATGKELTADADQNHLANGTTTNGIGRSPTDPGLRGSHADGDTSEAVSQHTTLASHVASPGEEARKEAMDDNGEEMVEAAEDTVIY